MLVFQIGGIEEKTRADTIFKVAVFCGQGYALLSPIGPVNAGDTCMIVDELRSRSVAV